MNHQDLRIGTGPDFVMTVGKIVHSHHADLHLAFDSGAASSTHATHASLCALIKEIQEKLVAIGWTKAIQVDWAAGNEIAADARGKQGTATIKFKFPKEMTNGQNLKMRNEIRTFFL